MIVIVTTKVPAQVRGHLTRWLLEISPGVYVGEVSARVRDRLWERMMTYCHEGRAVMVFTAANSQGMSFRTIRQDWSLIDMDGVVLPVRPTTRKGRPVSRDDAEHPPPPRQMGPEEVRARRMRRTYGRRRR